MRQKPEWKPFVFGVGYVLGEPRLEELLHQQFASNADLKARLNSMGYEVDSRKPKKTINKDRRVMVEIVGINKNGGVGSLELIDEADKPKVQDLIDQAADIQRRRKAGDPSVMGFFG